MTYGQLDALSNRLAHYLKELGVVEETLVAVSMEHSMELVISLLGILNQEELMYPIDPSYPPDRKRYILSDSKALILLGSSESLGTVEQNEWPEQVRLAYLDSGLENLKKYGDSKPETPVLPAHLAYVIYTSGSSGRPKGVMITHSSLADYALSFKEYF